MSPSMWVSSLDNPNSFAASLSLSPFFFLPLRISWKLVPRTCKTHPAIPLWPKEIDKKKGEHSNGWNDLIQIEIWGWLYGYLRSVAPWLNWFISPANSTRRIMAVAWISLTSRRTGLIFASISFANWRRSMRRTIPPQRMSFVSSQLEGGPLNSMISWRRRWTSIFCARKRWNA